MEDTKIEYIYLCVKTEEGKVVDIVESESDSDMGSPTGVTIAKKVKAQDMSSRASSASGSDMSPRKRSKLNYMSPEDKAQRRKLMNRMSAQNSRERRKALMTRQGSQIKVLEEMVDSLQTKNKILGKANKTLVIDNNSLRNENLRLVDLVHRLQAKVKELTENQKSEVVITQIKEIAKPDIKLEVKDEDDDDGDFPCCGFSLEPAVPLTVPLLKEPYSMPLQEVGFIIFLADAVPWNMDMVSTQSQTNPVAALREFPEGLAGGLEQNPEFEEERNHVGFAPRRDMGAGQIPGLGGEDAWLAASVEDNNDYIREGSRNSLTSSRSETNMLNLQDYDIVSGDHNRPNYSYADKQSSGSKAFSISDGDDDNDEENYFSDMNDFYEKWTCCNEPGLDSELFPEFVRF